MRASDAKFITPAIPAADGPDDLWFLANHDPLTGLFNRRRFVDELERELAASRRYNAPGALLLIDLDHFKDVNDSLGHPAGDEVLVRVGRSMGARLRATDRLARLGGDEFAVILPACDSEGAVRVADDIADAVSTMPGVNLSGWERRIEFSGGIALFQPDEHSSVEDLLVEADLALYRAKGRGGARIEVYDSQMREETNTRLRTEDELTRAIVEGQFTVHFQPIVDLVGTGAVVCEALVRWQHPARGLVGPAEFIPVAERSGAIAEIGAIVLDGACAQARAWRDAGHQVGVTVNVSPAEIGSRGFPERIEAVLRKSGLPPELLWVEVTERSLIDEPRAIVDGLAGIRRLGVVTALDDFGTGSSSLGALRTLPLDVVKIDRLFVGGLPHAGADRAIVTAVMSMADEMGLRVVAEGVEQPAEHWDLLELGCEMGQGFLYSRPGPAAGLELGSYSASVQPGVGDPSVIREFMRQIGIPARIEELPV